MMLLSGRRLFETHSERRLQLVHSALCDVNYAYQLKISAYVFYAFLIASRNRL
jgi:hypothetical protein